MIQDKTHFMETVSDDTGAVLYSNKGEKNIIGEIEIICESMVNGKPVFTRNVFPNALLVTGAVYTMEKTNSMRSTFKTIPLDQELGIHTPAEIIIDNVTINQEKICGIMVGNGGSAGGNDNTTFKVDRAAKSVPGMLPFRVVPVTDDLPPTVREKYIMRLIKGDYVYYYGKKFDIDRNIIVEYEDGTTVPTNTIARNPGEAPSTTKFIKTYTEYVITLDKYDIREYFKLTQGSTLRSLINSIGLITGYPGLSTDKKEEYFNVRGMTAANTSDRHLKDAESTITFIYRLFVQ